MIEVSEFVRIIIKYQMEMRLNLDLTVDTKCPNCHKRYCSSEMWGAVFEHYICQYTFIDFSCWWCQSNLGRLVTSKTFGVKCKT